METNIVAWWLNYNIFLRLGDFKKDIIINKILSLYLVIP